MRLSFGWPRRTSLGGGTVRMGKRLVIRRSRNRDSTLVMLGSFGVTLWRRGAVSFQWRGHFLQVVFGDRWKATPKKPTGIYLDGRLLANETVHYAARHTPLGGELGKP